MFCCEKAWVGEHRKSVLVNNQEKEVQSICRCPGEGRGGIIHSSAEQSKIVKILKKNIDITGDLPLNTQPLHDSYVRCCEL